MLTIQPSFSPNRMHSMASFGNTKNDYDYGDYNMAESEFADDEFVSSSEEKDSDIVQKHTDLLDLKDGVSKTMANIKDLEEEVPLPKWAKESMGVLYTLGTALVAGIGTKFGVSKTSEYLGELANKSSVKKASSNIKDSMKKLGKSIGQCFTAIKKSSLYQSASKKFARISDSYKASSLGKGIKSLADKFSKNSFVVKAKEFFAGLKNINSTKVVDRTGDVIGAATGVSTAAVGIVDPEKKERLEG